MRVFAFVCASVSLLGCQAEPAQKQEASGLETLERRGSVTLLARTAPGMPDTDQQPVRVLYRREGDALVRLRSGVRSAVLGERGVFAVTTEGQLVLIDDRGERVLLEQARGKPALLGDGSVVVAREKELGETDLWQVSATGEARALAPAPGPDDLPIALPDGSVVFVSGRTGIASLWQVDPRGGPASQLTNRGLAPGRPLTGFVPPPNEVIEVASDHLSYDAGGGRRYRVELPSGAARTL
ncbi:MAG: hypothetical protein KC776_10445 [Myxococcales bacterium]|nr:hypothetical protein [Myxococcales bacterium]MCB9577675.1 hypothetical protein [Polyangiaceae bacterium]